MFNLITKDNYNPGESDYSVTTLLKSPQQVQLERRHYDKLEEDAVTRVWSLFGSVAHDLLDRHGSSQALTEERLYVDVLGRKVGGQVDCYHSGTITDYKVTSAWTLVYGSRIEEWTSQLNIYAYILRQNNYEVNRLQIVAVLRDHDKNKAKQDHKYPQVPIVIIPLELWSDAKVEAFIYERVLLHKEAEELSDECLPLCTKEDMWEQDAKYAVMKDGRKTAVRVLESYEAAEDYITDGNFKDSTEHYIIERVGKRTKCEDYCSVKDYCLQYKKYKEETNG